MPSSLQTQTGEAEASSGREGAHAAPVLRRPQEAELTSSIEDLDSRRPLDRRGTLSLIVVSSHSDCFKGANQEPQMVRLQAASYPIAFVGA